MNDELDQLEKLIWQRIEILDDIIAGKHKRKTKREMENMKTAYLCIIRTDIPKVRKNRGN